jgi:hypothetical protein
MITQPFYLSKFTWSCTIVGDSIDGTCLYMLIALFEGES